MKTDRAIDGLDNVFRDLRTAYGGNSLTVRDVIESMSEEELRQWLIKFIFASNQVVQSRL